MQSGCVACRTRSSQRFNGPCRRAGVRLVCRGDLSGPVCQRGVMAQVFAGITLGSASSLGTIDHRTRGAVQLQSSMSLLHRQAGQCSEQSSTHASLCVHEATCSFPPVNWYGLDNVAAKLATHSDLLFFLCTSPHATDILHLLSTHVTSSENFTENEQRCARRKAVDDTC